MLAVLIAILFPLIVSALFNLSSPLLMVLQALLAVAAIYVNINLRPREISEEKYQELALEAKYFPRSKRCSYPMIRIPRVNLENPWGGYVEELQMNGKTVFRIMVQKKRGMYVDYFLPEERVIFEPPDQAPCEEIHLAVTCVFGNILLSIIPKVIGINIYVLRIPISRV